MQDIQSLKQRHEAFWKHEDLGKPLVRVRPNRDRELFENVDLTPDMLDVDALTPEVGVRDWRKRLVQGDLLHTENAYSRVPWMEAIVGCDIRAGADEAMWPKPALGPNYEGMERIVPGDDNPWLVKLLALTRALVEANDGSYLVTHTLMRGPIDLLSALMGDVRMGLGFYDEPERLAEVLSLATQAFLKVARAQYAVMPPFEGGWSPWMYCLLAPGTVIRLQSDSASQLSPRMYREQILPHDRAIFSAFDYSIIDLHSAGTLHLHPGADRGGRAGCPFGDARPVRQRADPRGVDPGFCPHSGGQEPLGLWGNDARTVGAAQAGPAQRLPGDQCDRERVEEKTTADRRRSATRSARRKRGKINSTFCSLRR